MDNEDEKKAKYLGRFAAALYLRAIYGLSISVDTLAKKAVTGCGPPFRKAGKDALYEIPDLDAYAESIIGPKVHSTAGLPPRDYRPKGRPRRTVGNPRFDPCSRVKARPQGRGTGQCHPRRLTFKR